MSTAARDRETLALIKPGSRRRMRLAAAHTLGQRRDEIGDRRYGRAASACRPRPETFPTASTSADPTTTPSAPSASARACSPVLTPKPTQTGSLVWRLIA